MRLLQIKSIVMTLIIGVLLVIIGCAGSTKPKNVGSNVQATIENNVEAFDKISIKGSTDVRFHVSDEYRTVVTIREDFIDDYEVFVKDNVLNIGMKKGKKASKPKVYIFNVQIGTFKSKYSVDVFCPTLKAVSIEGSADFKTMDRLVTSAFKASIAGSGDMKLDIDCEKLTFDIAGSGDIVADAQCETFACSIAGSGNIEITGSCNTAKISIAGSGDFHGKNFTIIDASVSVAGSSDISVNVSGNLTTSVAGFGKIVNHGSSQVSEEKKERKTKTRIINIDL